MTQTFARHVDQEEIATSEKRSALVQLGAEAWASASCMAMRSPPGFLT